jgi:hypothetical protein
LRSLPLLGVSAMPALGTNPVQRYPIHPAGLVSRTIASATATASRAAATS